MADAVTLQELIGLDLASLVFYLFAAVVVGAAIMVISARNSVHSVFFLILSFFTAAGLMVLLGAEYLAMTLVIVYVGAVAVLFLFVVMMLNVNFANLRAGFLKYLPVGLFVAAILFIEMAVLFGMSFSPQQELAASSMPIPAAEDVTNAKAIGRVLYTDYIHLFQLAGIVLLVAMIGAIVLTHRTREGVKKQKIAAQVSRRRSDSIAMVDVKPGQGV